MSAPRSANWRITGAMLCSVAVLTGIGFRLAITDMAFAGLGLWTTNGPKNVSIFALAVDPRNPGVVYAGSNENSGMYKTTNRGESWTPINTGFPDTNVNCIAVNPVNTQIVYAATTTQGVYKSTNGGSSWSPSGLTQTNVWSLAVAVQNPSLVYAGTYSKGMYKSTNSGDTWTDISTGIRHLGIYPAALDPRNPDIVYIGTRQGGGVYKTINGGASWSQANNGLPDQPGVGSIAIDPSNPSIVYAGELGRGVYKSTNAGQSWFDTNNNLNYIGQARTIWSLLIEPSGTNTIYTVIDESGIYKSTDAGGRWTDFNSGLQDSRYFGMVADNGNPITLYVASSRYGVFQYTTNASAGTTTTTTATSSTTTTGSSSTTTTGLISGEPHGSLDTPKDKATVSGNVYVSGWAFIQSGSRGSIASRVELLVDGTMAMVLNRGINRPDVQGSFPGVSLPANVGIEGIWDSRSVADGSRNLQLRVFDASNNSAIVAAISVTTQNGIVPSTTTSTTTSTSSSTTRPTTTAGTTSTTTSTRPSTTTSTSSPTTSTRPSTTTTTSTTSTSTTSTTLPAGKIGLSFSSSSGCGGAGGGAFNMEIDFSADRSISEMQFDLIYSDSVLNLVEVMKGSQALLTGKNISTTRVGTGIQRIQIGGNTQNIGNGIVAIARFQLAASARVGRYPVLLNSATARSPQGQVYPMPDATKEVEVLGKPLLTAVSPRAGGPGAMMVLTGMNFGNCPLGLRVSFRNDALGYYKPDVTPIEVSNRRVVVLAPNDASGNLKISVSVAEVAIDPAQAGNFQADPSIPFSSLAALLEEPTALDASALPSGAAVDSQTNIAYLPDNSRRTVTAINLTTGKKADTPLVSGRPVRVAVDPVRGQVVVTTDNNSLLVMKRQPDGSLQTVGQPVGVGSVPLGVAIDLARNRAVVANSGSNSISIVDLSTRQKVADIPVGREPVAVAIDGNRALVTNAGDNSLSEVNLDTRSVTSIPGVGVRPTSVDILPESRTALVGSNNGLLVYNTETRASTSLLPGQSVDGIAVHAGRGIAEVVNNATGTVTTITPSLADPANPDRSIIGAQPMGGGSATGLAINPLTNQGILAFAPAAGGSAEQSPTGGFSRMQIPPSLNFPRILSASAGENSPLAALAISNSSVDLASFQATAISLAGQQLQMTGLTNPLTRQLSRQQQESTFDYLLLGDPIREEDYWLKVVTPNPGLKAFFLMGDFLNATPLMLVGAEETGQVLNDMILPAVPPGYQISFSLINPSMLATTVNMDLIGNNGITLQSASRTIPKYGALQSRLDEVFSAVSSGQLDAAGGAYVRLRSSMPLRSYQQFVRNRTSDPAGLNGQSGVTGLRELVFSHFVHGQIAGQFYETRMVLINLETTQQTVALSLNNDNGATPSRNIQLAPQGRADVSIGELFSLPGGDGTQGWLRVQSQARLAGYLTYSTPKALAAVVSLAEPRTQLTFSHVAESGTGYFTGLAIVNTNAENAQVKIEVFSKDGNLVAATDTPINIAPNSRVVRLLNQFVGSAVGGQAGGYVRVTSNVPVHGIEIFGTDNLSAMANVPAQ